MKLIIALLFLSLGVLSYGQNEATCNIDNYRDYIYTIGNHQCDLANAVLYEADLRGANLYGANLQWAKLILADLSLHPLLLDFFLSGSLVSH